MMELQEIRRISASLFYRIGLVKTARSTAGFPSHPKEVKTLRYVESLYDKAYEIQKSEISAEYIGELKTSLASLLRDVYDLENKTISELSYARTKSQQLYLWLVSIGSAFFNPWKNGKLA